IFNGLGKDDAHGAPHAEAPKVDAPQADAPKADASKDAAAAPDDEPTAAIPAQSGEGEPAPAPTA
ncbi:hypothetical protein ACFWAX_39105, partial [Streptomyces sp. NPDC059956]